MLLKASDMPNYIVTIRDVEVKTVLDFLSTLSKQQQDEIETKRAAGLWQ